MQCPGQAQLGSMRPVGVPIRKHGGPLQSQFGVLLYISLTIRFNCESNILLLCSGDVEYSYMYISFYTHTLERIGSSMDPMLCQEESLIHHVVCKEDKICSHKKYIRSHVLCRWKMMAP